MDRVIVRVEKHGFQTRITIPKQIAKESGLVGAELASVRLTYHGFVEVARADVRENGKRGLSESKD